MPEKGWVSYQAGIGRALLGKKTGETAGIPDDAKGLRTMTIVSISSFTDIEALGKVAS